MSTAKKTTKTTAAKKATKTTARKTTAAKKAPTTRRHARAVTITHQYGAKKPLYIQGYGSYKAKEPKANLGAKIGSFLGGKLHDLVSHITGFGDYDIEQNSIMTGGLSPPEVMNTTNHGGVVVRHREYIGDIGATTAFTLASFALNPGLNTTFPWLSNVAESYEEYRWRGLLFEFKSLSSDAVLSASTSSALGSVIMATEYNVLNPNFVDKKEMENYDKANSSKPSCTFIHPVECAASQTPVDKLFVRSGVPPAGADLRLYDLGNFQIATVGMQAATGVAGELWATYEVEFFKPRYLVGGGSGPGDAGAMDHFNLNAGGGVPVAANPFGPLPARSSQSTLGGTLSNVTYTFPSNVTDGNFMVYWRVRGASSAAVTNPSVTTSALVLLSLQENNSATVTFNPVNGTTTSVMSITLFVTVTSGGATITLGTGGTFPGSMTYGDLYVVQIPTPMNLLRKKLKYLNVRGVYEESSQDNKRKDYHNAIINPSRWEIAEEESSSSEEEVKESLPTQAEFQELQLFEQFKKMMALQRMTGESVMLTENKRNSL